MKDELGERMKSNYEDRTRFYLPRRTYTVIRLDGKAFHTFTKGFKRPFDLDLMKMMDDTAIELCESIQGVKMAFVQSDEITLVLTDFESAQTDAWFDGNIQKMASISASIATAAFNQKITDAWITAVDEGKHVDMKDKLFKKTGNIKRAIFDSRVFSISDLNEVVNNLIWRQQDATRNSIQMAAQSMYSHKELNQKNTSELQEMIFQKGTNWNDYPVGFKRGRIILKEKSEMVRVKFSVPEQTVERVKWGVFEPPIFTQDKNYILSRLPRIDGMIVGGLG